MMADDVDLTQDRAEAENELLHDARERRMPGLIPCRVCYFCSSETRNLFCDLYCREEYEQEERARNGRH
jgi:hypothetical protein